MIGDPSGRSDLRQMMTKETTGVVEHYLDDYDRDVYRIGWEKP